MSKSKFGGLFDYAPTQYVETAIFEQSNVRIVECTRAGVIQLYRMEYIDGRGYAQHSAHYDLVAALEAAASHIENVYTEAYAYAVAYGYIAGKK